MFCCVLSLSGRDQKYSSEGWKGREGRREERGGGRGKGVTRVP